MKLTKNNGPAEELRASRGAFYIRATKHGLVAQAWPRKRGMATTGYDFYRQREFAIAARWASHPEPKMYQTAVEMTRGTEQVPRDVIMMAIMGTYYTFVLPDGTEVTGARVTNPNPQYILDLITEEVGSMIWRDTIGWVGITPGEPHQILQLDINGVPTWVDAAGTVAAIRGTWTPSIVLTGVQPTGLTYTTQIGRYVYMPDAKLCWLTWTLVINAKGSGGTGEPQIIGVPYAAKAAPADAVQGAVSQSGISYSGSQILSWMTAGASQIRMGQIATNVNFAFINWTGVANGDVWRGTMIYETD